MRIHFGEMSDRGSIYAEVFKIIPTCGIDPRVIVRIHKRADDNFFARDILARDASRKDCEKQNYKDLIREE